MKKIYTQEYRILRLLKSGRWVKVQAMHEISWRYGAHLFDLRKKGVVMEKRRQRDCRLEEWRLVKLPSKLRV